MSTFVEQYARVLGDPGIPDGSNWYFYCPFEGCAGYQKRKLHVNVEDGRWYCFHCSHTVEGRDRPGGTWRDFITEVGDEENLHLWPEGRCSPPQPTVPALPQHQVQRIWTALFDEIPDPQLLPEDARRLRARAINGERARIVSMRASALKAIRQTFGDDLVMRAGLLRLTLRGRLIPRTCVQRGRLLIPYREWTGVRYFVGYARCPDQHPCQNDADYALQKKNWVKCAGPLGYPTQIYGSIPRGAPYLVVTEGQLKTIAALQAGFPCVGIPGIGLKHPELVRQCRSRGVKRVILCFDSELDQETVDEEAEKLARELLRCGIPTFRALLPLDPGVDNGEKMDIDSFLAHFSRKEFAEVLAESARRPYVFRKSWLARKKEAA